VLTILTCKTEKEENENKTTPVIGLLPFCFRSILHTVIKTTLILYTLSCRAAVFGLSTLRQTIVSKCENGGLVGGCWKQHNICLLTDRLHDIFQSIDWHRSTWYVFYFVETSTCIYFILPINCFDMFWFICNKFLHVHTSLVLLFRVTLLIFGCSVC
jgi:hypothetical protein